MKRLAAIVAGTIAAAAAPPGVRAEGAITVRATPVASGADPSALFDAQLAAEIAPYKAPCVTGGGCGSTVVRQQALGGGMLVQLRRAEISGGAQYGDRGPDEQLLLRRHGRWYTVGSLPLDEEDCGAGTCTTQTITSIRAKRAGDILWVALRVRTERAAVEDRDCPPYDADADLVFAFVLRATPTCARVFPSAVFPDGDPLFDSYTARVTGRAVVLRWRSADGSQKRAVVHVRP